MDSLLVIQQSLFGHCLFNFVFKVNWYHKIVGTDYRVTALKKIVLILSGLLSAALLARYLGPELRAEYAVIINTAIIFSLLLNFGVSNSYQPARRQNGFQVSQAFTAYSLLLFTTIISLTLLVSGMLTDSYIVIIVVASVTLVRIQLQSYSLIESIHGSAYASIAGSIFELLIIIVIWIFFPANLFLGLFAILSKDLIIALVSLYIILDGYSKKLNIVNKKMFLFSGAWTNLYAQRKIWLCRSFPFFTLTVLIGINYKIDIIFLDFLLVEKHLIGIFAIGVLIAEYLWIFSDIFKDVQISRTARGGSANDVAYANRAAIAATLFLYLIFLFLGQIAITIFFGSEFSASFEVAALMLIANIFMIPCKIIGVYYISLNRVNFYLIIMFISVVMNISLNILFIPLYGVYGAIGASIASYFLAGTMITVDFVRFTGTPLLETLIIRKVEIIILANKFRVIFNRI